MSYPDRQYSHVTWVRKDSAAFKALIAGLRNPHTAPGAVTTFLTNMTAAHEAFKEGLHPNVNMMALLTAYQNATGIVSTREFTLPDIPGNSGGPGNDLITDLIEGIAGAAMTEIGIGISLYALAMDLIELFDIKLHLQGMVFNTASTDLENIDFRFGPNGIPNVLPLSATIPAPKPIMNPVDKKNYDCVGFTLFGGVGYQSLEGFYIAVTAQRKRDDPPPMYCQYYAQDRGIASGFDDRNHAPLREVFYEGGVTGVMVEQVSSPNGIVAIVYG
ncbi:hypothetical protein [Lysobacter sp. 1R34A]|uniref:hypothetical protein n=1 Tax=Lysobacter sp. 1R34A TaxID=3445786 RepID=UPI003EEDDA2D